MKIIATDFTPKDGINRKHRDKGTFVKELAIIDCNAGKAIAAARMYETKSRVYCCVWIFAPSFHANGSGFAGGYGYHKESAALEQALESAGVTFNQSFGGAGSYAMEEAFLNAVKYATGEPKLFLHTAHG